MFAIATPPLFVKNRVVPIHGKGDALRAWREGLRLKQFEIADQLGIKRSYYANLESGQSIPERIYQKLLMMGFDRAAPVGGKVFTLRAQPTAQIKIYGAVSAGDGHTGEIDDHYMDVPVEFARQDYAGLIADGMSMFPLIAPGDTLIFCDHVAPKLGYIFAVELPGGEWVVKQLAEKDGEIVLRSLNPHYDDIHGPYRLGGFLVGVIHDDGPERIIRLNPHGIKP